jgi:hypothetical protein
VKDIFCRHVSTHVPTYQGSEIDERGPEVEGDKRNHVCGGVRNDLILEGFRLNLRGQEGIQFDLTVGRYS